MLIYIYVQIFYYCSIYWSNTSLTCPSHTHLNVGKHLLRKTTLVAFLFHSFLSNSVRVPQLSFGVI